MNLIKTILDADLGFDTPAPDTYTERSAARAVVFDHDGNVALLHATIIGYHKLPGGGMEEGETIIDALRREIAEEIGCEIENIRELGMIEEYRDKLFVHQISYCFLADLSGEKGTPHLEPDEIAEGFQTAWIPLAKAITTIEHEKDTDNYEGRFITVRDLAFLKAAQG